MNGISALMAAKSDDVVVVDGGNTRMVERMINLSRADLQLNSRVTKISLGHSKRYILSVSTRDGIIEDVDFDIVILATPIQTSQIDLQDLGIGALPSASPLGEIHVTQLTTPRELSPSFFNVSLDTPIPENLFTASANPKPDITYLTRRQVCYLRGCLWDGECDQCEWENFYHIVTHHGLEDSEIERLLSPELPEGDWENGWISWLHRRKWPYRSLKYSKDFTFGGRIEIAKGLFYLGGAVDIFSSMELSCRMGLNVAALISRSTDEEL